MENVKVTLASGEWWEVVPKLTVGMAKAVAGLQGKVVNLKEAKTAMSKGKELVLRDNEGKDLSSEITFEMLFAATVSWSYGPVTQEIYKRVPLDDYNEMARRIDELYGEIPLSLTGGGTKK